MLERTKSTHKQGGRCKIRISRLVIVRILLFYSILSYLFLLIHPFYLSILSIHLFYPYPILIYPYPSFSLAITPLESILTISFSIHTLHSYSSVFCLYRSFSFPFLLRVVGRAAGVAGVRRLDGARTPRRTPGVPARAGYLAREGGAAIVVVVIIITIIKMIFQ